MAISVASQGFAVNSMINSGGGSLESLAVDPSQSTSDSIPPHPLRLKPAGNQYTAVINSRDSVGPSFGAWPDEILGLFLEYLEAKTLLELGASCKFLHAFCKNDDLWKALFIELPRSKSGSFVWRGTWRSTFLDLPSDKESQIDCSHVFSDVLYRPFLCAHTSLTPYTTNIPTRNAIPRMANISHDDFSTTWSSKPFILTDPVKTWPVYQSWDTDSLLSLYSDVKFRAEAVDWTLSTYIEYMRHNSDESPLYLFDRSFVSKMSLATIQTSSVPSYTPPTCFGEDLFTVLGDDRPDDKWLIVGPARSGSTYHKDPNATSAWNAVLRGSKYWIMFPSSSSSPPPPGVYVSDDQSEVTSPLSIAEWLLGFHAEARNTPGCLEGVCYEGEVLHVPSGWWHLVVNLDVSIAITQNFVPKAHLAEVVSFLRDKSDQVSGFKTHITDPYRIFVERMQAEHPDLLDEALEELKRKSENRKRKWEETIAKSEAEAHDGFSFGFGDDSDVEVP